MGPLGATPQNSHTPHNPPPYHNQQPGHTYTLHLHHFPPRKPLTVHLLAADAQPAIVGGFASRPDAATGAQTWEWTVGKRVRPGGCTVGFWIFYTAACDDVIYLSDGRIGRLIYPHTTEKQGRTTWRCWRARGRPSCIHRRSRWSRLLESECFFDVIYIYTEAELGELCVRIYGKIDMSLRPACLVCAPQSAPIGVGVD